MKTVQETLRAYIADNILYSDKGYTYPDTASFLENGIVDSMNIMEIVMYVEEKFGIQAEDREIIPDNFDSISNLAAFIERKRA
jgi:acyl carrier protein